MFCGPSAPLLCCKLDPSRIVRQFGELEHGELARLTVEELSHLLEQCRLPAGKEVATLCDFLQSSLAANIAGANCPINGGLTKTT